MKKETADSICGNLPPKGVGPCRLPSPRCRVTKPIVVGFPPINEDGFIKSHPERLTQLHSNKRGREDCADCPYPERSCDECINGARNVSSKSPEPAGEFVAKWRELYKRRTNMGNNVTLSWTDILKALACIERLGNERLVEVGQLKLDIISLQNKLAQYRWIPVNQPPEKDGQVWICYEITGYTYQVYYNVTSKRWSIFDPCGGFTDIDFKSPPTHWKPTTLPEGTCDTPFEAKENENEM
ncbi:MAG: hypothetical protein NG712_04395 [Omnitrophica bacterium]|nr:hypothetical protein [Candidatus Omnitrophota bacterium]